MDASFQMLFTHSLLDDITLNPDKVLDAATDVAIRPNPPGAAPVSPRCLLQLQQQPGRKSSSGSRP